jgi:hypothetical protein
MVYFLKLCNFTYKKSSSFLELEFENFINCHISVTNNKGVDVLKTRVNSYLNNYALSVKKLSPGIYYVVIDNGKKRYVARFIKSQ